MAVTGMRGAAMRAQGTRGGALVEVLSMLHLPCAIRVQGTCGCALQSAHPGSAPEVDGHWPATCVAVHLHQDVNMTNSARKVGMFRMQGRDNRRGRIRGASRCTFPPYRGRLGMEEEEHGAEQVEWGRVDVSSFEEPSWRQPCLIP